MATGSRSSARNTHTALTQHQQVPGATAVTKESLWRRTLPRVSHARGRPDASRGPAGKPGPDAAGPRAENTAHIARRAARRRALLPDETHPITISPGPVLAAPAPGSALGSGTVRQRHRARAPRRQPVTRPRNPGAGAPHPPAPAPAARLAQLRRPGRARGPRGSHAPSLSRSSAPPAPAPPPLLLPALRPRPPANPGRARPSPLRAPAPAPRRPPGKRAFPAPCRAGFPTQWPLLRARPGLPTPSRVSGAGGCAYWCWLPFPLPNRILIHQKKAENHRTFSPIPAPSKGADTRLGWGVDE